MTISRIRTVLLATLLFGSLHALADDTAAPPTEPVQGTPDQPGGPSLFDRARSLLSSGQKDRPDPGTAAEQGGAPANGSQRPSAGDGAGGEGAGRSLFGGIKSAFGMGDDKSVTKIKDITEYAPISAKQFDPACTSIVEPFGVTDNVGSLALLAAKIAASNLTVVITRSGSREDVKKTLRLASKSLNWLPMQAERMLGQTMHDALAGNTLEGTKKSDKEVIGRANAMLQQLLAQVKEDTPYKFDLAIQRNNGTNAQALPGGFITIDKGLTEKKNEARAYFAMAHEIAHVLQRHETRSVQARLIDSIDSLDGFRKLLDAASNNPGALLAYSNELMSRFAVFSKSQELQADACAVRLLDSAFNNNKRLVQVIRSYQAALPPPEPETPAHNQLEMLVENVGNMNKLQDLHPNSTERAANLEKMLLEVSAPKKVAVVAK